MSDPSAHAAFGRRGRRDGGKGPASSRAGLVLVFTLLVSTNLATLGGLVFTPEIQALLSDDRASLFAAYERRIVELRLEVDRLHARQYAQAGDINLQLHELSQQQDILAEQHHFVRMLAEQARALGVDPAVTGAFGAPVAATTGALPAPAGPPDTMGVLGHSVYAMQDEARLALAALSDAATDSTDTILTQLQALGLSPALPQPDSGMGGPFVPASSTAPASSITAEANAVALALARFETVRTALTAAPIRQPVGGPAQTTSNFGNRRDPFTGAPAFHGGMDFRATTGTPITAAGAGRVIASGYNGGYGNTVDIDHGNGLVTRYAHMSAVSVREGQSVVAGQIVGLAGSTGRSTGPHLHFEVRRNGHPVNPAPYLSAGRALTRFL